MSISLCWLHFNCSDRVGNILANYNIYQKDLNCRPPRVLYEWHICSPRGFDTFKVFPCFPGHTHKSKAINFTLRKILWKYFPSTVNSFKLRILKFMIDLTVISLDSLTTRSSLLLLCHHPLWHITIPRAAHKHKAQEQMA